MERWKVSQIAGNISGNAALNQIREKGYEAELIKRGVKKENIRHYGFAFKGKEVLIGALD